MQITDFLTPAEIQKYKSQNYSEADIIQAIKELQQEANQQQPVQSSLSQSYNQAMQRQQSDARNFASNTLVSGQGLNQNLIQWQLELDSILERVEHMLRGDKPKFVNGSLIFITPESDEDKIFTDFGVSETMRILSMYLNRNTILSNYDEETINWKVLDFGNEVTDLIYTKYETMFAIPTMEQCATKIFGTQILRVSIKTETKMRVKIPNANGTFQYLELTQDQISFVNEEMKKKHFFSFQECFKEIMQVPYEVEIYEESQKGIVTLDIGDGIIVEREIDSNLLSLLKVEQKKQSLEKRKLYPIIVKEIVDCVHSAYLRALNGGERLSLHESRSVNQNETLMPGVQFNMNGQPVMRERSMLNPMRWFGSKYK